MKFTKGNVRKLGSTIRDEYPKVTDDTLKELQAYRVSYKDCLSDVFSILCKHSLKLYPDAIVTYRVKRIETIIDKLDRYPDMAFDRMWDIAGCRCILKHERDVYKLKDKLSNDLEIRKVNDYIKDPKDSGYKSLHLYVSPKNDNSRIIEIQLRTQTSHNWATLVEITDFLFDTKIKERNSDKDLCEFHLLLSKIDSLSIEEKQKVFKTIKVYDFLNKLNEVFNRNYISVRKQWLCIESRTKQNFYLIEAKRNETPKIKSYASFIEAEEEYFNRFMLNSNSNIVLTHLPKASYAQISVAYSNYVLTYHKFIDDCYFLFESLLKETIEKNKLLLFSRYYGFYLKTAVDSINNLNFEIKTMKTNANGQSGKKKIKEWVDDINRQIARINTRMEKFKLLFIKNPPKSRFFTHSVIIVIRVLAFKYRLRLKK